MAIFLFLADLNLLFIVFFFDLALFFVLINWVGIFLLVFLVIDRRSGANQIGLLSNSLFGSAALQEPVDGHNAAFLKIGRFLAYAMGQTWTKTKRKNAL